MINFSFIIPHKNTPDLLRKCIDSIPHRKDVQIIVVDDCSDADKVDFDHFPGVGEPQTEVYLTKEGKGAGYARNVGLQHAVGKWIVFADADDFFHTEELESAMDEFVDANADVIFFKGDAIKIPGGERSSRADYFNDAVDLALQTSDFTPVVLLSLPVRKFYCRKLLQCNLICFNHVRWSNDVFFMGKVALHSNVFLASNRCIYCITESSNSLIKNTSIESALCRFVEECKNVRILRPKFGGVESIYYWQFRTWYNVYKKNKLIAIVRLPYACYMGGLGFIKQVLNAKFK